MHLLGDAKRLFALHVYKPTVLSGTNHTLHMILHWLVSACAIMLTSYVLPRATATLSGALIASIVLGLANIFIKPLLVFFTLPINILTLGFFTLIINGLIILFVSALTPGFKVGGLGMAILFALILSVINMIFFKFTGV